VVAVGAMSWAGPLIRFGTAPPLVIAAWRLLFSVALIGVLLLVRRPRGAFRIGARGWGLALGAGALLAAHFWSWIAPLEYTTVASSAVLVSMQPVFVAALSAVALRERATPRQWVGIGIAVTGAVAIGWANLRAGGAPRLAGGSPLAGDLLALAGAVFAAGYYVIGRRLRQEMELLVYIGVVYGIAALFLLLAALASPGVALVGYPRTDWLIFLALAFGPMMIGHTGVNYALRYLPAYVANLAALGEPIGATIIAWLLPAIGETPTPQVLVGGALILMGVLVGALKGEPRGGTAGGSELPGAG
jgi:drug/metabolite transporter (DMT)-like permease